MKNPVFRKNMLHAHFVEQNGECMVVVKVCQKHRLTRSQRGEWFPFHEEAYRQSLSGASYRLQDVACCQCVEELKGLSNVKTRSIPHVPL